MAQPLKSLTYEDIELFCEQSLQAGNSVTLDCLLAEFPNDSIDAIAYFHQWRQCKQNQSSAISSQSADSKPQIPQTITQILQEEIAKLQASQAKEQQVFLAQQREIEEFLITKSQELKTNLDSQSKYADETKRQLEQQSQQFQEKLQQLTQDYNTEINTLKRNHQQSLIAQQQDHKKVIEGIISQNEAQLTYLEEQVAQLIEEKEAKDQQLVSAKKQYQESLKALRDVHQQEVNDLNTNHQNELNKKLSDTVIQDNTAHEELAQLQHENNNLKRMLAEEESNYSTLKARFDTAKKILSDNEETKGQLVQDIEDAKAKIAELELRLSERTTALAQGTDIDALEKAERMIAVLRKDNNQLANQLTLIKTNSVATIERLTDKSDQAFTRIKALESELELEIQTNSAAKEQCIALKDRLELMKHNQASTFERLTQNAEQAKAKIKELEQQLAEMRR